MMFRRSLLLFAVLFAAAFAFAQPDSTQPPYKRFPTVPPFRILLGDSATMYTKTSLPKGKPVLLMLFSPECSHCQHTAEEMVLQKEKLKDIQIVMVTLHTISEMNAFAENYGLKALPNVVLGKDVYFILPPFYAIRNLPYLAFYKRNGDLIDTFEGGLPVERIAALFQGVKR